MPVVRYLLKIKSTLSHVEKFNKRCRSARCTLAIKFRIDDPILDNMLSKKTYDSYPRNHAPIKHLKADHHRPAKWRFAGWHCMLMGYTHKIEPVKCLCEACCRPTDKSVYQKKKKNTFLFLNQYICCWFSKAPSQ